MQSSVMALSPGCIRNAMALRPEFFYFSFYRPSRPNFLEIEKKIKEIFFNFIFLFPSDSCQYSTGVQLCIFILSFLLLPG